MKKEDKKIWLFALVLVLILLIILVSIFNKNASKDNLWQDYSKFSYADAYLNATKVQDRTIYWTLDKIISDYIGSYSSDVTYDNIGDNNVTYEDYYDALYEGYQKYLKKEGYLETAKNFLQKFMIQNDVEAYSMETEGLIDSIYMVEENIYLCNLSSKIQQTNAYIIIGLNTDNLSFKIMYME